MAPNTSKICKICFFASHTASSSDSSASQLQASNQFSNMWGTLVLQFKNFSHPRVWGCQISNGVLALLLLPPPLLPIRIWKDLETSKCSRNIQNLLFGFSYFLLVLPDLILPASGLQMASAGFAKRKQFLDLMQQI